MAKRKGYEFRSHTADVELAARGKTIEEAFSNAVLAMFDTSADIAALEKSKGKAKRLKVRGRAATLEDLLWAILQDILSLADAEGVYGYKVRTIKIAGEEGSYKADLEFLAKEQDQKYSVIYVKGVSRYRLRAAKKGNGFIAGAVLDV